MDAITFIVAMVMGWAFAVATLLSCRADLADQRAAHVAELERRDAREQQLLDQVQLNTQNMPYYPTIGPLDNPPAEPERRTYDDGMGYLEVSEDDLVAALDEIDRLA